MANEIDFNFARLNSICYAIVRNATAQPWNTGSGAFENYLTANYANYAISCTQQSVTSPNYQGSFPTGIGPGMYGITALQQLGGSPAESDPVVANGNLEWNGVKPLPRSDLQISGQAPLINIYKGEMVPVFPFLLVSSVDSKSAFTSGVVSGSISRDGGAFGPLQSGAFSEIGNGFYQTVLTSGDLLCKAAALLFTAVGVSGGTSDPRRFTLLTPKIEWQLMFFDYSPNVLGAIAGLFDYASDALLAIDADKPVDTQSAGIIGTGQGNFAIIGGGAGPTQWGHQSPSS